MLLDLSPLRRQRDYRFVFAGQRASAFGIFLTYVALPVPIYEEPLRALCGPLALWIGR